MDYTDTEIRQYFRNWAAQQPLPKMGRRDLIRAAMGLNPQCEDFPAVHNTELLNNLHTWAAVNCIDHRIVNLRPFY